MFEDRARTFCGALLAAPLLAALLLSGCASEESGPAAQEQEGEQPAATVESGLPPEETHSDKSAVHAESCDWGAARLPSGAVGEVPDTPGDDLATVLIGAWQHTHIDSGSGYEALSDTTDIRFVFPSTTRLLYCQDVEGATDQSERAVDWVLEGTAIVLPDPAPGYVATAWTPNTMVWTNNFDGSSYLLQRR